MEITNEIKVKVFGQYAKKNMQIMYAGVISNLTAISLDSPFVFITTHVGGRDKQMVNIENVKLITKLLSDITDEDKVLLVRCFEGLCKVKSIRIEENVLVYAKKLTYSHKIVKRNLDSTLECMAYQFLQSKGYDLPNYYLGGKTLIESGLAVDIKTLK